MNRSGRIVLRVKEEEKEVWVNQANKNNSSLSEWIREQCNINVNSKQTELSFDTALNKLDNENKTQNNTTEKYNRIVIIGNGYDLASGFKTTFSDFVVDLFKSAADPKKVGKDGC